MTDILAERRRLHRKTRDIFEARRAKTTACLRLEMRPAEYAAALVARLDPDRQRAALLALVNIAAPVREAAE